MKPSVLENTQLNVPDRVLLIGITSSLLAIAIGPLVPDFLRGGTLVLIAIGLIWRVAVTKNPRTLQNLPFWPLLIVTVGVLPSLLNSTNVVASQETLSFLPIGFALFLGICIEGRSGYRIIALTALAAVFLISIEGVFQYFFTNGSFSGRSMAGNRVRSSMPHPNDIAIIPMLLPIAVVGIRSIPRRIALTIGSALVPLVVFTVATSWSRNTWIGLLVTSLALAVWKSGLIRIAVVTGFILAVGIVVLNMADIQNRLISLADPTNDGRIGLWLAAMTMFIDHPFTGIGAGTFGYEYPTYVAMVSLPTGYVAESGFIPWAHNVYLEILAEYGIPGFLAYAIVTTWIIGKLGLLAVRSRGTTEDENTSQAAQWRLALLISWLAVLVMAMFDLTFYKHWVVYIYWMLLGLSFSVCAHGQAQKLRSEMPSPPG